MALLINADKTEFNNIGFLFLLQADVDVKCLFIKKSRTGQH